MAYSKLSQMQPSTLITLSQMHKVMCTEFEFKQIDIQYVLHWGGHKQKTMPFLTSACVYHGPLIFF